MFLDISQAPLRELAILKAAHPGTPRARNSRRRVRTRFHCFQRHIRSLLRIHWSNLSQCPFAEASRKYPIQPIRYRFNFRIRSSIAMGRVRFVNSRIFSLNREIVLGARRIVAYGFDRKLNPRNFRFHGRSTALLSRFTFNFSLPSTKRITDSITRSPARLLATKMLQSSA